MSKDQRGLNGIHRQASQGSVQAQRILGQKYLSGEGVPKDYPKALRWLRLAAEGNEPRAKALIRQHLRHATQNSSRDDLKFLRAAAAQGVGNAQTLLAEKYRSGKGVECDYRFAKQLYLCAIHQGEADAEYHLESMHLEDAMSERAMARANAQTLLAEKYRSGKGVKGDHRFAERYLRAARQSKSEARHHIDRRDIQAAEEEQARANAADAMYQLGSMYQNGLGVSPNKSTALKWIKKAAESGHLKAMRELADKRAQPNSDRKLPIPPVRKQRPRNQRRIPPPLDPGSTGSAHT